MCSLTRLDESSGPMKLCDTALELPLPGRLLTWRSSRANIYVYSITTSVNSLSRTCSEHINLPVSEDRCQQTILTFSCCWRRLLHRQPLQNRLRTKAVPFTHLRELCIYKKTTRKQTQASKEKERSESILTCSASSIASPSSPPLWA